MTVTFAVNVLVLLYNVYMKRLEGQGEGERSNTLTGCSTGSTPCYTPA